MQSLSEKASKGSFFFGLRSSKITLTKEKERRKSKSEEEERRRREKTMAALLVFIIATLKKLLHAKGPFHGNVFKNPARIFWEISSFL